MFFVTVAFFAIGIGLAWLLHQPSPPTVPNAPAVQAPAKDSVPANAAAAQPGPHSTVLLVNLLDLYSATKRNLALQVKIDQMRTIAGDAADKLSGDERDAYIKSAMASIQGELASFRTSELDRIIAATQFYRQAGGFTAVYDSSSYPDGTASFGLDLLPPGISGQDGTSEILAILDRADSK